MDQPQQSTFVTVLGWIVVIFGAMATLAGVLQSLIVGILMTPLPDSEAQDMPAIARFMFANFHWFVYATTVVWAIALAAGAGLLKRKEWARRVMTVLFVIGAVGNAAAAIAQQLLMSTFFQEATDAPAEFQSMMVVMRFAAAIFGLAFVGLCTWVAVRLNSVAVRAEFSPPTVPVP